MMKGSGQMGAVAAGGSVLAAAIASACCWLPLLLIVAGASAVGVSAFFDQFRPWFLVLSVVLLGVGFYMSYFRREPCRDSEACSTRDRRLHRFSRMMLWVAVIGVAAFAFFPSYVSALLGGTSSADVHAVAERTVTLRVDGMTCEGCSITVEQALLKVPGVVTASVSYESGQAVVVTDPQDPPPHDALVKAVEKAGYDAALKEEN